MFCTHFQVAYVRRELDTFKREACLLVAVNKGIYWNVGESLDIPQESRKVEFKNTFENDTHVYNKPRTMVIDSLANENGSPLSYSLNLELFYQVALELKYNSIQSISSKNQKNLLRKKLLIQK